MLCNLTLFATIALQLYQLKPSILTLQVMVLEFGCSCHQLFFKAIHSII